MSVTTAQAVDVSAALAMLLAGVDGLRVSWYVNDTARPPIAVIGMPTITFNDPESTFCWGTFEYSLAVVTARANDRDSQQELSRLVRDVANALNGPVPEGIFSIDLLDARPSTVSIGTQDLPSYIVRVEVRA